MTPEAYALIGVVIGGAITSASTYFISKQNHKTELEKAKLEHKNSVGRLEFERRTKMLTECAGAVSMLFESMICITVLHNRKEKVTNDVHRLREAKESLSRSQELKGIMSSLMASEGNLLLLGESRCAEKLMLLLGETSHLLNKCVDSQSPEAPIERVSDIQFINFRNDLIEELRKAFNRCN